MKFDKDKSSSTIFNTIMSKYAKGGFTSSNLNAGDNTNHGETVYPNMKADRDYRKDEAWIKETLKPFNHDSNCKMNLRAEFNNQKGTLKRFAIPQEDYLLSDLKPGQIIKFGVHGMAYEDIYMEEEK